MEPLFTKSYDAAVLALSVLKRLESDDIGTFEGRLRAQKVQYLAQLFGVSPAYQFSLYVRGPYSPDFTRDLYAAKAGGLEVSTDAFVSEALEASFNRLEEVVIGRETRELELLATYHWLSRCAGLSDEKAAERLTSWKGASNDEVSKVRQQTKLLP